jgi:hypothetical protein
MVLADGLFLSTTALGLTLVVAWGVRRYYRSRLVALVHELEAARAASAHHALWAEEQRIELSTQVRSLQGRLARAESQPHNDARRNRSPWTPAAASSRLSAYNQVGVTKTTRIATPGLNGTAAGPVASVAIGAAQPATPAPPTSRTKRRAEPPDFADTEPLPRR